MAPLLQELESFTDMRLVPSVDDLRADVVQNGGGGGISLVSRNCRIPLATATGPRQIGWSLDTVRAPRSSMGKRLARMLSKLRDTSRDAGKMTTKDAE